MNRTCTPTGPRARKLIASLAVVSAVTLSATVAGAHATFPKDKNASGGTGVTGSTPPYAPNTTQSLALEVPFEQSEPFNGSDDTTVDVRVFVPVRWHQPVCGAAKTLATGTVVPGWTCGVSWVNGHYRIRWTGPQVVAPKTSTDSAEVFEFQIKTPAPGVQTTYNGANGTEGFIVDQRYASGTTEHWIPNAAFAGTPPVGSATAVAAGLARTVAPASAASVTTKWTATELPRLQKSADYFGVTPEQLQKMGVQLFEFLLTISNPRPAPEVVTNPPANSGTASYTTTWSADEIGFLRDVQAQYSLTAPQAQKFGVNLISFLLALGGN